MKQQLEEKDKVKMQKIVYDFLIEIGEDPKRDGLKGTPRRVEELHKTEENLMKHLDTVRAFLKEGEAHQKDNYEVTFLETTDMVTMDRVSFNSLCEHHMLGFNGIAFFAYIPRKKVLGASKIIRVLYKHAYHLQTQERMARDIADELFGYRDLNTEGVYLVVKATHGCISDRGVKNNGAALGSAAVRGSFLKSPHLKTEALTIWSMLI